MEKRNYFTQNPKEMYFTKCENNLLFQNPSLSTKVRDCRMIMQIKEINNGDREKESEVWDHGKIMQAQSKC